MRLSFRHLLTGVLLAIWCMAISGLALPLAPQALLKLHLLSSVGGAALLVVFLGRHWWSRRDKIAAHRNTPQGYIALAALALLTISGLALLAWTNVAPLRWLHDATMIVLLLDLTTHMSWRWWKDRSGLLTRSARAKPRMALRTTRKWLLGGVIVAGVVVTLVDISQATATHAQEVLVPVAPASLADHVLFAAPDCANCHSAITQQWRSSAHAHAATDTYYQAVTTLFIEERGAQAVQYCATCHNPIGLMQGEVDPNAVKRPVSTSGAAYQARKLGIALPISDRAAEGVTCAMCHQAAQIATAPINGSLQLATNMAVLPTNTLDQLSLRAVPASHKETLLRPVIQQAELCGSCHNLRLPDNGAALEPTYDEWKASPYPERGMTCQSCHLPQVPGPKADSSPVQTIGAHGNIPGAVSSLPGLADDPSLLKKAAALSANLIADPNDPAKLVATIVITNTGAGHHLPTGANDLRQMWLELTLRDSSGQVAWSSGTLDKYGTLDPSAVQFHKVLGDANGHPIDLHRIWIATQVLTDTSLLPLEARTILYQIALPSNTTSYTLTVRLLYRDVSQAFAEFAQDGAVPDLPTREMARTEVLLNR
ncbi:MAG TPA: multiheme c-type cytochrome [Anaerolineae bacterium]|nr:multiheme c-type cytochrome [Anaerolineae bacterium]